MNTSAHVHLDAEDCITTHHDALNEVVVIEVGRGAGRLVMFIPDDQLPERIAEFQAVMLALRNRVDTLIADEKANTAAPDWESVLVADLTAGRLIQRCGHERPDQWRTVTAVHPHPYLPGCVLVSVDEGESSSQVVTLNERDAVRAQVVTPCCDLHQAVGCCDTDDCGPCCENCPTCPTLARQRAAAVAS